MDKYYFKGSNTFSFLSFIIITILVLYLVTGLIFDENNGLLIIISIISFGFVAYFISIFWLNFFYFFDDKTIIFYPTRILQKRKKIISYRQITSIRYTDKHSKYSLPTITLEYNSKGKLSLPSNSFSIFSYKKRQTLLKFLNSKGLLIKIISELDKDRKILD